MDTYYFLKTIPSNVPPKKNTHAYKQFILLKQRWITNTLDIYQKPKRLKQVTYFVAAINIYLF